MDVPKHHVIYFVHVEKTLDSNSLLLSHVYHGMTLPIMNEPTDSSNVW